MEVTLDPHSLRALGALMEKEMTTPENYPLSLNSLIAACNQRSSREPVLDLTEDEVRQSIHVLEDLGLVTATRDARVPKYEHRARTVLNLRRDETAIVCLLLLRGPQTPGELRSRADRMFPFDDLAQVVATLDRLAARAAADPEDTRFGQGPLTVLLPRQPGAREARYAHLLGDPSALPSRTPGEDSSPAPSSGIREELAFLKARLDTLEARLAALEGESVDTPKPS